MRKLTYEQVIENSISHLNKNYTEGQLGFTEKIHLSEEITALVSGLVDSINECIEERPSQKDFLLSQISDVKKLHKEAIEINDPIGTLQYGEKYKQLINEYFNLNEEQ